MLSESHISYIRLSNVAQLALDFQPLAHSYKPLNRKDTAVTMKPIDVTTDPDKYIPKMGFLNYTRKIKKDKPRHANVIETSYTQPADFA